MLPLLQVVTKNDLIKRQASVFLEQMFNKYGIDSRVIVYADLRPLFKNAPGFIIKKFELDEKLSKEDLKEFRKLCGGVAPPKAAPVAPPITLTVTTTTPVPPKPKTAYPINKSKGTGKTK